jgi:hypothetical protein
VDVAAAVAAQLVVNDLVKSAHKNAARYVDSLNVAAAVHAVDIKFYKL